MAVAWVGSGVSFVTTANDVNSHTSAAFTPGAGDVITVQAQVTGIATALTCTMSDGTTMTQLDDATFGVDRMAQWISATTVAATSRTITISWSGTSTGITGLIARVSGAEPICLHHGQTNGLSGTAPAITTGTFKTQSEGLILVTNADGAAPNITAPTGWTRQTNTFYNSPNVGVGFYTRDGGETGSTITCGSISTTDWRIQVIEVAAKGTLQVASGSYAITGTNASLLANRALSAGSGSFAITGTDATIKRGINLVADAGSFDITGTDVSILINRLLAAAAGSIIITGTDATLTASVPIIIANDQNTFTSVDRTTDFIASVRTQSLTSPERNQSFTSLERSNSWP